MSFLRFIVGLGAGALIVIGVSVLQGRRAAAPAPAAIASPSPAAEEGVVKMREQDAADIVQQLQACEAKLEAARR